MRKIIILMMICCLVFVSCKKNDKDDTQKNNNKIVSESISSTEAAATPVNNEETNEEFKEAKEIIEKYYNALAKNDIEEANKYRTKDNQLIDFNEVESIKIKEITDDKNNKEINAYLANKGTITNPEKVICVKVVTNTIYNKNKIKPHLVDLAGDGENKEWVTLVKMTKESIWQIDEQGYYR